MQPFLHHTKIISFLLIIVLLIPWGIWARDIGSEIKVSNVRFETKEKNIVIHYDLSGAKDNEYNVIVQLRKESDSTFAFTPQNIEGDIGKGYFAGTSRTIVWNLPTE